MNEIVFAAQIGCSRNKNKFNVAREHRIIEARNRKSSMNGLVFTRGNMRLINENEDIIEVFNFQYKIIELVAVENIVPKL